MRTFVFIAAALAIMTTCASATYLSGQGTVLVNDQPVPANAEVVPGDRVKAVSAPVNIVYGNGAVVTVEPGHTVVVRGHDPENCIVAPPGSNGMGCPEIGMFAGGMSNSAALGVGAAVAVGVGAAIVLTNNGSSQSSPVSP